MVMVVEKSVTVLDQVNDDENIQKQNDEDWNGETAHQFVNLNGDKENRFADSHPACPTHAIDQAHAFDQGEQAVNRGASRQPEQVFRRNTLDAPGEFGKKFALGIDMDPVQELSIIVNEVVIGETVEPQSDQEQQHAFAQLYGNNGVERRRPAPEEEEAYD